MLDFTLAEDRANERRLKKWIKEEREYKEGRGAVAGGDQKYVQRTELAAMSIYFVILQRWDEIKKWSAGNGVDWPMEEEKQDAYDVFERIYDENGVTHLVEWQEGIDWFKEAVFAL